VKKEPKEKKLKKIFSPVKRLKLWFKQSSGIIKCPIIVPYRGFGNEKRIIIYGSVIEDNGLAKPERKYSKWHNFLEMVKRFTSDSLPGIKVKASFLGKTAVAITNEKGIFEIEMDISDLSLPGKNWHKVDLELIEIIGKEKEAAKAQGEVLLLKKMDSTYGIISDIDDTILISHATNFVKKLRLMLFKSALTRLPFEGVAGFYRALHKGYSGKCYNPIFYVSSSQWNIYDLLVDFCTFRNIPKGIFMLENFKKIRFRKLFKLRGRLNPHMHKINKISLLLETYPHLNFILIGDSGQKDAEIYKKIALEYPGRILAIYIRDIRKSRAKKVMVIGKELNYAGIEMLLIKDTVYAAEHAIKNKFIKKEYLQDVIYEKEQDHFAEIEI
jgi:phosphatidate phosphatase APP1